MTRKSCHTYIVTPSEDSQAFGVRSSAVQVTDKSLVSGEGTANYADCESLP